jgi:alkylation response protein AidB-like acyl-CoA dehydrogenase
MEEGCARVAESRYIGCQRMDDPDHPTGPWRYYQTRFFTIFEGTSEIQRMLIGRAVTGLDVR